MLTQSKQSRDITLQNKLHYLAKSLRHNPTQAEEKLWYYLQRSKMLGYKFRRQYPLYSSIVDFYCHEKKLVIEVDGEIHNYQQQRDQGRDFVLQLYGCNILRFSNDKILKNIDSVLKIILDTLSI
ncbi:MAG: endonuclease domain-containing protein [Patescibacteria group bacterium]|jgi:very-short-patch-repair endonuclease